MLTRSQRLHLQQLRILEWLDAAQEDEAVAAETDGGVVADWSFARGIVPLPWQLAAADAWEANGGKGTIKVVTGAGKTVAALVIADRLLQRDPDFRIAVVVPTITLLRQWHLIMTQGAGIPDAHVARLGGGSRDRVTANTRVILAVLATARRDLPNVVQEAGIGDHLLLVVDESHRAGADESSAVLDTKRVYSLGLSATPERTDDGGDDGESDRLWDELGGIVYEMSFADAIRDGILPPFEVRHYGISLAGSERVQYDRLTRSISDARTELLATSASARRAGGGGLMRWAVRTAASGTNAASALAAQYVGETTRRKRLLYGAENREAIVRALIGEAFEARPDARIILFHESISEATALFLSMERDGLPVVLEHSELPNQMREANIDLFRQGVAQIVVSVRSLIEGFNVPEADLGIIVASSSSMRQRIQSIGRVLRRFIDADGNERASRICILYARDTVDELIYEKADWGELIGLDRNRYFTWDLPQAPVEVEGPPREAVPDETSINVVALMPGDEYPGRYAGDEFSIDRNDNVVSASKEIASNPQGVPTLVRTVLARNGRFRVTPKCGHVLVRMPLPAAGGPALGAVENADGGADELWVTRFCGVIEIPFIFDASAGGEVVAADFSINALSPGDAYLGRLAPAQELVVRQRRGGILAKKVRAGEIIAEGPGANLILTKVHALRIDGIDIHRVFVNEDQHVFWREAGGARFIAALDEPLAFPAGARE